MRNRLWLYLLLTWTPGFLLAQADSVLLDKAYRFVDGAYGSWADLLENRPTYSLARLDGSLVLQAQEYTLKVERLHAIGRPDLPFDLQDLPVICLNGLPYVRTYFDSVRQFTVYAGLRVRGRLSYFAYELPVQDTVLIQAYNPYNGRPFRQQHVVKPGVALQEYLLNLTTGEVWPYTLPNLLTAIADDPALVKSLAQRSPEEARERMQKVILIYDDRHPLYLPQVRRDDQE
jgi:hypothetical protein